MPPKPREPMSTAAGHIEAGNALYERGEAEAALGEYVAALALEPRNPRAHFNAGVVLHGLGRLEEAIAHYSAAADADPAPAKALVNWGNAVKDLGHYDEAFALYRRALAIDPRDPGAHLNCGTILRGRGDLDGAAECYRRALELRDDDADALNNLGSIAQFRGELDAAESFFARALRARPGFIDARYNLALIALHRLDFENGWEGYELRFRTNPPAATLEPLPLPNAQPADFADGRAIVVRKEQGIGDQVLFSTLLPEVAHLCPAATVETDPRLVHVYRRSFPGLRFATPAEVRADLAAFERQFPIGSLPRLFRRNVAAFCRQPAALLAPDPGRVAAVASALGGGRKIGIAWRSTQSGVRRHIEQRKSAPLEAFAALGQGGAALIDLQYGDAFEERAAFDARHPGLRQAVPGLDLYHDLAGVLAAIACCNLVVTTSNVTAHLAGAVGKRTLLVFLSGAPPFPYWRPVEDRRCLWYPSVEIVTDAGWKDWDVALRSIATSLR